ncbi:Uncharacterised protein [Vibrio cholerae]|nr:Uncharacterised protein [Vibrio cholerae]CSI72791.1 Uncharacterised protein [Vibrio cholerae]
MVCLHVAHRLDGFPQSQPCSKRCNTPRSGTHRHHHCLTKTGKSDTARFCCSQATLHHFRFCQI